MKNTTTTTSKACTVNSTPIPHIRQGVSSLALYSMAACAVRSAISYAMPYVEGNALSRLYSLRQSAWHVARVLAGDIESPADIVGECADLVQDAAAVLMPYASFTDNGDSFKAAVFSHDKKLGYTRTGKPITPFIIAVRAVTRSINGERKRSSIVHDDFVLQSIMERPTDCIGKVFMNDFFVSLNHDERELISGLFQGLTQVQLAQSLGINQSSVSRRLAAVRAKWIEYNK